MWQRPGAMACTADVLGQMLVCKPLKESEAHGLPSDVLLGLSLIESDPLQLTPRCKIQKLSVTYGPIVLRRLIMHISNDTSCSVDNSGSCPTERISKMLIYWNIKVSGCWYGPKTYQCQLNKLVSQPSTEPQAVCWRFCRFHWRNTYVWLAVLVEHVSP